MILSDRDLRKAIRTKRLRFKPSLDPEQISPASIDLKLGSVFKAFRASQYALLDLKRGLPKDYFDTYQLKESDPYILHPHQFVLAATKEYIVVPPDLVVRVEGKSTLARMGILVHSAGYVDPGFEGTITLEISNQSNLPVALYPGMYICQISSHTMTSPAERPYTKGETKKYAGKIGPLEGDPSRLFKKKK